MLPIGIAGAGIGGLTAAIALARLGRSVAIFERAPALAEAGAGLQLSPNACRVLRGLGLLSAIEVDAVAPEALMLRSGRDGGLLARLPLGDVAARRFGAPFLVTHRADLQRVLLTAAAALPGIAIHLGATVTGWAAAPDGLVVRLAERDNPVALAGLVGADGIRSAVRLGLGKAPARFSGRVAWRSTVPAEAAPAAARRLETNLWLGPEAHLVHYPMRCGRLINVVAIVTDRETPAGAAAAGFWSRPGDPARLARRFGAWAAPVRQLLAAAPDWRVWPLLDRPADAAWSSGTVTLLGDAAHPMLPFLAQGAAQAIEDAAALAAAIGSAPSLRLDAAFRAYEAERRARVTRVQTESRRQARLYHLPRPASSLRDLALRSFGPNRLLARYDWLYAEAA